jgi:N-methylhydantoinase B
MDSSQGAGIEKTVDPVTYEVIRNALLMATMEMKSVAMRTAYSTVWREAGDLSCGILDRGAQLVAQGPADLPVHLATMPYSVHAAVERIGPRLREGDLLFHNDPAYGNNHLPDCVMIKPIWLEGEVVAYAAMRGHWADIGGQAPGSYSAALGELIQEGLRVPPIRLYRQGELDPDLLDVILANTRGTRQRMGDLRAQHASCVAGERRFLELIRRYGREAVVQTMRLILDRSEALTRAEIRKMPGGVYRFVDWCDGDGISPDPVRIEVAVTIADSEMTVDFSGSSPQTRGGINAPFAVTASAVWYAVKAATDPWNPANSGSYRPIRVVAPSGTITNPRMPAPVIAGNHETANIIVDAVFGALAQAVPDRVIAAGSGSAAVISIGGADSRPGRLDRSFVHVEPHGGAWGARPEKDGLSAIRVGVGNTGNQPVEVVETEYPLKILSYEIVPDTGGPGKFRGGLAARRTYRTLEAAIITLVSERVHIAPYGLNGGGVGARARSFLRVGEGVKRKPTELPAKTLPIQAPAGTDLSVQPAGGGGFGNPFDRSPEAVLADVLDGYVSRASARRDYGVVFTESGHAIDQQRTRRLREGRTKGPPRERGISP